MKDHLLAHRDRPICRGSGECNIFGIDDVIIGAGIGAAGSIVSGWLGSEGAKDAAGTEADAIRYQTEVQDRASRDFMATSIDWSKEQRDIMLTGTEGARNLGALSLAGLADMTGLDRTQLPGVPDRDDLLGIGDFERGQVGDPNTIYGGASNYSNLSHDERMANQAADSHNLTGDQRARFLRQYAHTQQQLVAGEDPESITFPDELEATREQFYEGKSLYEPGIEYDLDRLNDPNRLLREGPAYDWQTDPGYEFRLNEGQRAMERSFNAISGTKSGAYDKALIEHGQGFASNEFANVFSRLSTIAGYGPAASPQGAPGDGGISNFGNQNIQAFDGISSAGAARGQGQVGSANAWASAINQGAQGIGYGWDSWQNRGGGGSGGGGVYNWAPDYGVSPSGGFS